jgi:hypothetical protein
MVCLFLTEMFPLVSHRILYQSCLLLPGNYHAVCSLMEIMYFLDLLKLLFDLFKHSVNASQPSSPILMNH